MAYTGPSPLPIVGGGTGQTTLPAFFAYAAATLSNVTGDNTAYTVIFGTKSFDITTSYSTSTGLFTAPVTGQYFFTTTLTAEPIDSSQTGGLVSFQVSTGAVYYCAYNNPYATSYSSQIIYNVSGIIPLTAAQTVGVVIQIGEDTKTVNLAGQVIASGGLTTFGGWLIT